MNKTSGYAVAALLTLTTLAVIPPALAQGAKQVVTSIDVQSVATGYRSSKIIGADVTNEKGEAVGKIDDVIISKDQRALFAIVSVGGYLGIGDKLIAVRYEELRPTADNKGLILTGATKDGLKSLPEFIYAH